MPGEQGRARAPGPQVQGGMTTRSRSRGRHTPASPSRPPGTPSAGFQYGPPMSLHAGGLKRSPPRCAGSPSKRGPASPPPPSSRETTPSPTAGKQPSLQRRALPATLRHPGAHPETPSKELTKGLETCSLGHRGTPSRRGLFQDQCLQPEKMPDTPSKRVTRGLRECTIAAKDSSSWGGQTQGPRTRSRGPAVRPSYAAVTEGQATASKNPSVITSAGGPTQGRSTHSIGQPVTSATQHPQSSKGQQATPPKGFVKQRYVSIITFLSSDSYLSLLCCLSHTSLKFDFPISGCLLTSFKLRLTSFW